MTDHVTEGQALLLFVSSGADTIMEKTKGRHGGQQWVKKTGLRHQNGSVSIGLKMKAKKYMKVTACKLKNPMTGFSPKGTDGPPCLHYPSSQQIHVLHLVSHPPTHGGKCKGSSLEPDHDVKTVGQHFCLSQPLWVSACASSWATKALTSSFLQLAHCNLQVSNFSTPQPQDNTGDTGISGTHSDHLLGCLDRKTVGLDGGTGASSLSLLVLPLDLECVSTRVYPAR